MKKSDLIDCKIVAEVSWYSTGKRTARSKKDLRRILTTLRSLKLKVG